MTVEKSIRSILILMACASTALLDWPAAQAASSAPDPSSNWPQWRGPNQNGVAPHADPPTEWSETKNVKWKVKIPGYGSATPIVWENKVFLITAIPTGKMVENTEPAAPAPRPEADGPGGRRGGRGGFGGGPKPTEIHQFAVLCLDRQTGQVLWQRVAREEVPHEGHHRTDGTFASASPVTDGQHVWAHFGSRGLYCYDLNGTLQWNEDLGDMRVALSFGEGSSPALHGEILVANWDHEGESFITALDKKTGQARWKVPREERTSWSTPLVMQQNGKAAAIVAATGKIRSYDLATGQVLWECGGLTSNVIPSPVSDGELVYCMSGFRGNALLAIRLGKSGDLTGTDAIAWSHNKNTPYVPSPLLYGEHLYFLSSNNNVLSCFNAKTGQVLIDAQRLEGLQGVYASPVGAQGRVYLVGRNGVTAVLKKANTLEILATNSLDEKFDASPAVAGKDLFLRGRDHLYCLTNL